MENDFRLLGEDFTDFIHNKEDIEAFEKMKSYAETFHKPAIECIHEVLEYERLRRHLLELPDIKVIFQQPDNN